MSPRSASAGAPSGVTPLAFACLSLAIAASSAIAQELPDRELTLDRAIEVALNRSPAYLQQRNDIQVARAAMRSAYGDLAPNAALSAGFGYTGPGELRYQSEGLGDRPDYYSSEFSVRLSYQVSGSSLLQPGVERSRLSAVERRVEGSAQQLTSDVTRQYLAALQARERRVQAVREVARTVEHVRLAEARLQVGTGTPLDVRSVEVQHGQAEVRLVQAEHTAAMEVLRLGQLLGVPVDDSIELTTDFAIFEPPWADGELLRTAAEGNAALLAARASVEAARASTRAARSQYLPSVSLNVGLTGTVHQAGSTELLVSQQLGQLEGGLASCLSQNEIRTAVGLSPHACLDPHDELVRRRVRDAVVEQNRGFPFGYTRQPLQASLGVSVPVFSGFDRSHQVAAARAAEEDARYQLQAEELRLRQEVTAALLTLRGAYRTALLQQRVLERAEEELRLATERFRFGAATSVEVIDAQTNVTQAEIESIETVFSFHQSLASLEALVGESLR